MASFASTRTPKSSPSSGRPSPMAITSVLNEENNQMVPTIPYQSYDAANNNAQLPPVRRMQALYHHFSPPLQQPQQHHHIPTENRDQSLASNDPSLGRKKRQARVAYSKEEEAFIWFLRVDKGMKWNDVAAAFERYFGTSRAKSGMECKIYRILNEHGIPPVRQWRRCSKEMVEEPSARYGILEKTDIRYPWMSPDYRF